MGEGVFARFCNFVLFFANFARNVRIGKFFINFRQMQTLFRVNFVGPLYSGGRRLVSPTEGVFRVELGGRVSGSHLYTNMKLMELRKNGNVLKNGGVLRYTEIKNKITFSSYIRKFRRDLLQSHI